MLWHAALGVIVAFGMGAASGWSVRDWKAGADDADRIKLERSQAQARQFSVDAAATGYEGDRAKAATRERIVVREVDRVVERPVYRSVCLDADGLRILADDIRSRRAGAEPAASVPAATRAD